MEERSTTPARKVDLVVIAGDAFKSRCPSRLPERFAYRVQDQAAWPRCAAGWKHAAEDREARVEHRDLRDAQRPEHDTGLDYAGMISRRKARPALVATAPYRCGPAARDRQPQPAPSRDRRLLEQQLDRTQRALADSGRERAAPRAAGHFSVTGQSTAARHRDAGSRVMACSAPSRPGLGQCRVGHIPSPVLTLGRGACAGI